VSCVSGRQVDFELVVEICSYEISERQAPVSPATSADWESYFEACAQDAGLGHLDALPGSHELYSVANLDQGALSALATHELKHYAAHIPGQPSGWTIRQVQSSRTAMDGGVAIVDPRGERIAHPGCCADLTSLGEWIRAVQSPDADSPWCGHDAEQIEIRHLDGQMIEFVVTGHNEPLRFTLSQSSALDRLQALDYVAESFADRLDTTMQQEVPDTAARAHLSQAMAGTLDTTCCVAHQRAPATRPPV